MPADEGGEQADGDAETDEGVGQEEDIAGCDLPLGPAEDPRSPEGVMDGVADEEGQAGRDDEGVLVGPARAHRLEHAVEGGVPAMLVVNVDGRNQLEPPLAIPRKHWGEAKEPGGYRSINRRSREVLNSNVAL